MNAPLLALKFLLTICLLGALHLCPLWALAAEPPAKDDDLAPLRAAADNAMRQYSKGLSTAGGDLMRTWWWNPTEAENSALALQQCIVGLRPEAEKHLGPPILMEFEYLGSRRLGAHTVSFCYLQKHEWKSLELNIGFYRRDGQWRLNAFQIGEAAEPAVRLFFQVEHAAALPPLPAQAPDFLRPANLADIRLACDTFMARLAQDQPTQAFKPLLSEHWVSPQNMDAQIAVLESHFRQAQPQILANMGRPLPGQPDFLGLTRLGTNLVHLHYALHYERGMRAWFFAFYRPGRAWRLYDVRPVNTPDDELQLLYSPGPPDLATRATERPVFDLTTKTLAGIAKGLPTALDEVMRDAWIDPPDSPKTKGFLQSYQANLPLLLKVTGPSLADGVAYLGYTQLGKDALSLVHLHLREQGLLPISTLWLRRDAKWKLTNLFMGGEASDDVARYIRYTILSPPARDGTAPAKPPLIDLPALEQSCQRYMTRVTTGQAKGAVSELMAAHKPLTDQTAIELLTGEATYLGSQFKFLGPGDKPLAGQFEYLGWGSFSPQFAKLVFLQHYEGGTAPWSFVFYRPKAEWLLHSVNRPGSDTAYLAKLEVLQRP